MKVTRHVVAAASRQTELALRPATLIFIRTLLFLRVTWFPLVTYASSVVAHLTVLRLMMTSTDTRDSLLDRLTAWDGKLFIEIARNGYPHSLTYTPTGQLTGNNLAFMPLYPTLVRLTHELTGLSYETSALTVSHLSLVSLLITVNALVWSIYGRRVAYLTVWLLAMAEPMGVVYLMGYSEALFTALAAGTLLAIRHRHWVTAGVLTSLAGLTRPVGVAVTVALLSAVIINAINHHRVTVRPIVALGIGSVGLPAYLTWVGLRVGHLNGWFIIQYAGWGTRWDNGRASIDLLAEALSHSSGWVMVSTAVLLTIISSMTISSWRSTWLPMAVYGVTVLVMTLGQSNYYHCKLRLLLPILVCLIPAARTLQWARRRTLVTVLTLSSLIGCWYGAYMLTVWHYAI